MRALQTGWRLGQQRADVGQQTHLLELERSQAIASGPASMGESGGC